ncbi:M15 family metallopeptidase, partial [Escherichia coli]|uniref:M15 family metallopeptidase n=1 Tax=Escherichia coli TaxID=562 RepID=UPI0028DE7A1D
KTEVLIVETKRTVEQQKKNVAKGASQTMRSYHLVGQALDFVPASGASIYWDRYSQAKYKNAVKYAKSIGFTWGGDWTSLVDKPH